MAIRLSMANSARIPRCFVLKTINENDMDMSLNEEPFRFSDLVVHKKFPWIYNFVVFYLLKS